jgi:hypothetical protein
MVKPDKQIATLNRNPDQHGVQIHEGTRGKSIVAQPRAKLNISDS